VTSRPKREECEMGKGYMFGHCCLAFLCSFYNRLSHLIKRTLLYIDTAQHTTPFLSQPTHIMDSTTRTSTDSTKGRASIDAPKRASQDAGKRRPVRLHQRTCLAPNRYSNVDSTVRRNQVQQNHRNEARSSQRQRRCSQSELGGADDP
jgi:hypothetical protein